MESLCSVEKADFRGWQAVYLRNGLITLVAVPDIGGRLMAYDLGPYPFLFVDPDLAGKLFTPEENQGDGSLAAWKNYGGDKTWPAPQGWETDEEWHGPPDPVLDSGRYTLSKMEASPRSAVVRMDSPPDPHTGIQITRQAALRAGSSRVDLDLTFTNRSQRLVRWSIWDVVQLRAERTLSGGGLEPETGCTVTAPLNPHSRFPLGFNVMFGRQDNPQWGTDPGSGLFTGRYRWEIGKVGLDSLGGWVAFSNSQAGYGFVEQFQVTPGADYPDGGATVECWTVGKGKVESLDYGQSQIYLMETEVLSPLFDFQPGEARTFSIQWGACRCPGPIVAVSEAGCAARPLEVRRSDGCARLTGSFGVFDSGELSLLWKAADGSLVDTVRMGRVDPLKMVLVDCIQALPAGAAHAELQVLADSDGGRRALAGEEIR